MNGRMAKRLRSLVVESDPNVLLAVRSECGDRTKDMEPLAIYRIAKRLYTRGKLKLPPVKKRKEK